MRVRRHTSTSKPSKFAGAPWRRFLRDLGLVLATFVIGYAISAFWISPTPVFSRDHAVPRVLDLPQAEARARLSEDGFRARNGGERTSGRVPAGSVVWQDPPPGVVLPPNSVVELVLSAGPAASGVPDVIGMAVPIAERVLDAAGMKVGVVDTVESSTEPGVVLATRPAAGQGRPRGAAIDLVVSGRSRSGL